MKLYRNKWYRKLRRFAWAFHEAMSPLGHVVWVNHRIQEYDEAIEWHKELESKTQ